MIVNCPRCGSPSNCAGFAAGTSVSCPQCRVQYAVPPQLNVIPVQSMHLSEPPADVVINRPPTILINTAPPSVPRLKAQNWFANAYGTTMGVVLGLLTIPLVVCGGLLIVGQVNQPRQQQRTTTVTKKTVLAPANKATLENYHRVHAGMSRARVFTILGAGEQINHIAVGETTVESYSWSNGDGTCAITFENGAVASKVQFGLP